MLETLLVKAYSIPHKLSINNFINDYMILLNKILNDIRQSNRMEEERKKLIPFIRKDFQKIYYKMAIRSLSQYTISTICRGRARADLKFVIKNL
jgi:hypothetical protein